MFAKIITKTFRNVIYQQILLKNGLTFPICETINLG